MSEETGWLECLYTNTLIKSKSSVVGAAYLSHSGFSPWVLTVLLSSPPSNTLQPFFLVHSVFSASFSDPQKVTDFADYGAESVRPADQRSGR